jgi:hypothetical protein
MNQKNIFTVIAALLALQGIAFYLMGDKVISDSFPTLDAAGKSAAIPLLQVIAALSFGFGLVIYATRNFPQVLGAFTLGSGILLILTLKHKLADHINVPVAAIIIQFFIVLSCVYLLMQNNKAKTA